MSSIQNVAFPKKRSTAENIVDRHIQPASETEVDFPSSAGGEGQEDSSIAATYNVKSASTEEQDWSGPVTFTHDTRRYGQKQLLYAPESMTLQVLSRLTVPTLHVWAALEKHKPFWQQVRSILARRKEHIRDYTEVNINANHHLHSDEPEKCAQIMLDWWKARVLANQKLDKPPTSQGIPRSKL
jgi:pimeloyl-ACP methyl ester carboxylesterase